LIKDFQLQGVRDVIVDVTCRYEFRGSCANQERNGEPSRAQFLLPPGSHDDLRENQRRLPPPALHTVSPPSSKLLHTHEWHHRSIPPGIQTTPRLVLLLQSRRHRPRIRPGHCNEDVCVLLLQDLLLGSTSPRASALAKKTLTMLHTTSQTPTTFTSLHTPTSTISNPRHLDDSTVYHSILYKMGK